jgi:hypothetical protein
MPIPYNLQIWNNMAPARNEEGRDCLPSLVPLDGSEYSVWKSVMRINNFFLY